MKKRKLKSTKKVAVFLLLMAVWMASSFVWLQSYFADLTMDKLIFQMRVPMTGTNSDIIWNYLLYAVPPCLVMGLLLWLLLRKPERIFKFRIFTSVSYTHLDVYKRQTLGRMTRKSPVGAYASFGKSKWLSFGGWINAIIPVLIVPYYSVIGGWVIKYLFSYVIGQGSELAADGYFSAFISDGVSTEICFVIFALLTVGIIYAGVRNGVELSLIHI